ncbi:MAG: ribbon-helix-helix protein, CopG family, partial [Candidatus Hydrothermarchaeaceae archaeon]
MQNSHTRTTVSLDEETRGILEKLKIETKSSRSSVMRQVLRFYSENRHVLKNGKKINAYLDLLASSEHIILDVDHWLLFLEFISSLEKPEEFWDDHKRVARSHAEQFSKKMSTIGEVLERLEVCNFYNLKKVGEEDFVLLLNSEPSKKFIKT